MPSEQSSDRQTVHRTKPMRRRSQKTNQKGPKRSQSRRKRRPSLGLRSCMVSTLPTLGAIASQFVLCPIFVSKVSLTDSWFHGAQMKPPINMGVFSKGKASAKTTAATSAKKGSTFLFTPQYHVLKMMRTFSRAKCPSLLRDRLFEQIKADPSTGQ